MAASCYTLCAQRSWFPAFLGVIILLLASGIIYLYAVMLRITSSADRFEGIPCYIVGTLLLCSGIFLILLAKPSFQENLLMIRSSAALFIITLLLSSIAVVMTLFLAEKQDRFSICIDRPEISSCLCRSNNDTNSDDGWIVYRRVTSCSVLDSLFHLLVVMVTLYSIASFLCFLAVVCLCFLWRHYRQETISTSLSSPSDGGLNGQYYANAPLSDWDSWLFSYPWFRRFFTDGNRHPGLPPTYEQSQRVSVTNRRQFYSVTLPATGTEAQRPGHMQRRAIRSLRPTSLQVDSSRPGVPDDYIAYIGYPASQVPHYPGRSSATDAHSLGRVPLTTRVPSDFVLDHNTDQRSDPIVLRHNDSGDPSTLTTSSQLPLQCSSRIPVSGPPPSYRSTSTTAGSSRTGSISSIGGRRSAIGPASVGFAATSISRVLANTLRSSWRRTRPSRETVAKAVAM